MHARVEARALDQVLPALLEVEQHVAEGKHAAGFVTYEAAPAMDGALAVHDDLPELPFLRFGIYDERIEAPALEGIADCDEPYELGLLSPTVSRSGYERGVRTILDLVAAGDTYQVNYTFRLRGRFKGSALTFYRDLCRAQQAGFCAYLPAGDSIIVSASPELFFRRSGQQIELRPMKGTRPRGRWSEEDEEIAGALASAPKDRAENLMIVDLLRNDLGRVAEFGTVRVPTLFEVESYPTVHQLTSTVAGRLRPGTSLADLFRALFPSGSITGAPKIRTSQIIRDLEDSVRGSYTGAIGFVSPGESVFSVAIRTAIIDQDRGAIEVGVGSGITADSAPGAEYQECLEKGAFLRHREPEFELLESLRLEAPQGYPLLQRHLERLQRSARYFRIPLNPSRIAEVLEVEATDLAPGFYKIRLRVDREGRISVGREAIPEHLPPAKLRLAAAAIDESDRFLYHKTTYRRTYDDALRGAPGCDDVVLFNRRGEITETATGNLVLERDGELLTAPVECGLLPGVLRGKLVEEGTVREQVLEIADLERATAIHVVNAVRGWRRGVLSR